MKTVIQILSFGIVGLVLTSAGIGITDWQFYTVLVMMAVNGPSLSSEAGKQDEAKCHCVNPVLDCHESEDCRVARRLKFDEWEDGKPVWEMGAKEIWEAAHAAGKLEAAQHILDMWNGQMAHETSFQTRLLTYVEELK